MEHEHEEVYNKPWEIWAFEKCRECSHHKFMHLQVMPNTLKDKESSGIVGSCNEFIKGAAFCLCQEYLPLDNLDYIELLAKRRGLISDEKDKI